MERRRKRSGYIKEGPNYRLTLALKAVRIHLCHRHRHRHLHHEAGTRNVVVAAVHVAVVANADGVVLDLIAEPSALACIGVEVVVVAVVGTGPWVLQMA